MINQLDQQAYFKTKINQNRNIKSSIVNRQLPLRRSDLLLKLSFNLSKGHYNFVSELLKSKLEKQNFDFEIDVDETIKVENLQFETNRSHKKFLFGKTPLILCTYLKENEWAINLSRLLIQNGANVSLRDHLNGCTALHYACSMLKLELIEILLRNTNFSQDNLKDYNGNTPLFYLISSYAYYLVEKINIVYTEEKFLQVFQIFLKYLRHYNLKINAYNRFGLSLYELWNFLFTNNQNLKDNETFNFIGRLLKEENSISETKILKNFNSAKMRYENENVENHLPLSNRLNIDFFLKRNLLIDLKTLRVIKHSNKMDDYLIYIFLKKISPNELPVNFYLIRDKSGLDKNIEIYRKNTSIPFSVNQSLIKNPEGDLKRNKFSWRDRFNQLYNSLEIRNSESFRKSAKNIEVAKQEHTHHGHHNGHHHSHQAHHGQHGHHNHGHDENVLPQLSHRPDLSSALSLSSIKKQKSNSISSRK
ncbi:unnamed protein product [Brachionus calyciflorus]|uniref:Uncharacterized protein n=1 Tax=Brachionus calyciflorus TaxID=104777 RepID=A0A814FM55_9BILA|nr:unnamed protein product [Brachionus calyciflorus]